MTILDALDDPALFASHFADHSWRPWRSFLATCHGLPTDATDLALYRECTGRQEPPTSPTREAWCIVGRRGGKSRIAALVGVYQAAFVDHPPKLAPGEVAVVAIIASDRQQAQVVFRYVRALLTETPMLRRLVVNETAEAIELRGRVRIEVWERRQVRVTEPMARLLTLLATTRPTTGKGGHRR